MKGAAPVASLLYCNRGSSFKVKDSMSLLLTFRLARKNALVSQSFITFGYVDYSAVAKTVLLQVVLQNMVIAVCIDTDVVTPSVAIL